MQNWRIAPGRELSLDRPVIMAILNVTPDSFADGGRFRCAAEAAETGARAVAEGAGILDIGGESTRPGAETVTSEEQIRRVVPVIERLRRDGVEAPISVDTTNGAVARAALDAGAEIVNDTSAGRDDPAMLGLWAQRACGVVLMHRAIMPRTDRYSDAYDAEPEYAGGVVEAVGVFLRERLEACVRAGVDAGSIVIDPGLGFGKSVEQNLALIAGTPALGVLGRSVVSALSRKSFVGRVSLGRESDPSERLAGTLAMSVEHLSRGARVFRVHDVAAHRQALAAAWSLRGA